MVGREPVDGLESAVAADIAQIDLQSAAVAASSMTAKIRSKVARLRTSSPRLPLALVNSESNANRYRPATACWTR